MYLKQFIEFYNNFLSNLEFDEKSIQKKIKKSEK